MSDPAYESICGSWQCDNSRTENFQEFLAEMGVNFMIRKLASKASPTMNINIADGKLVVKTETGFKTKIGALPLDGTEVDDENMDGSKGKAKLYVKDGIAHFETTPVDKGVHVIVTRQIENGELVQYLKTKSVTCKRIFKRK